MPRCPICDDEYQPGVARCADCGVALIPDGAPAPPRVDALLGTFHPVAATAVVRLLEDRGIAYDALHVDEGRVEVVVDRTWRDDVRAELAVNWSVLVARLEPEDRAALTGRSDQPGWYDPPRGAWVDAHGRLKVDPGEQEEFEADAQRTYGPTLATLGAVLLIFGWWGGSELSMVLGVGLAIVGLLLPR